VIRLVIADDQVLVRDGFCSILNREPDMEVVAEAADGAQAVAAVTRTRPDVALLDVRMPVMDGLQAGRRILAAPGAPRVLMLTTFDADEYVYEALRGGASGFLLKDIRSGQLTEAVRTVAAGQSLLSPTITRKLIERFILAGPATPAIPGTGRADAPRTRGAPAHRRRPVQRRDRGPPVPVRGNGQDAREPPAGQARPPGPGPSRRPRLRNQLDHARLRTRQTSLTPNRLTHRNKYPLRAEEEPGEYPARHRKLPASAGDRLPAMTPAWGCRPGGREWLRADGRCWRPLAGGRLRLWVLLPAGVGRGVVAGPGACAAGWWCRRVRCAAGPGRILR
jgi:DNA-binding NarL/FixJ family response regulator